LFSVSGNISRPQPTIKVKGFITNYLKEFLTFLMGYFIITPLKGVSIYGHKEMQVAIHLKTIQALIGDCLLFVCSPIGG
jgi:hypothetical protein